ncbi:MAG: thioredoxin domain-containing protein [Acidobacteria bacterium]|nr:thioredoxin domain-containing protein [Acidobacteriota bacterium]
MTAPPITAAVLLAALGACFAQAPAGRQPLAYLNGKPVYDADLGPALESQLLQQQRQVFEIKKRALEAFIEQQLLEAEAARRGVPKEQLLGDEVYANAGDPTEAEVEAYYLGRTQELQRPFEEVRIQMRSALYQARLQRARERYMKTLRERANVQILLDPPRLQVAADPSRRQGPADARVQIVEFSDFHCPYCARVQETLKSLLSKFNGEVSLAFRDFPLTHLHPRAQAAAEASRCVAQQGKFWEYHDKLFAGTSGLDARGFRELALKTGADAGAFDDCIASGRARAAVEKDLQEGKNAGVAATPGVLCQRNLPERRPARGRIREADRRRAGEGAGAEGCRGVSGVRVGFCPVRKNLAVAGSESGPS